MIVENENDLQGLMRIGQICGHALQHMLARVEPGMTTRQLDDIGAEFLKKEGAASAPITAYKYPGCTCISLNDAIAHGIPGDDVIRPGDMINIDVSAVLEGYWGDTGASMMVPPTRPDLLRLCDFTRQALHEGIRAAQAGAPIYNIGKAVQNAATSGGYNLIRDLTGHGVGRHIHEKPNIPNYFTKRAKDTLREGQVITIEPFLNLGKGRIYTDQDGWTLRTTDRSLSAQYEHTIIVDGDKPILVTSVEGSH